MKIEATYHSHSKEPAAHYHPHQEDFTVLSDELTVRMDGQLKVLKQGNTLHIAKQSSFHVKQHRQQDGNQLESTTGLSNDDKANEEGMPNILQVALMANNTLLRLL